MREAKTKHRIQRGGHVFEEQQLKELEDEIEAQRAELANLEQTTFQQLAKQIFDDIGPKPK